MRDAQSAQGVAQCSMVKDLIQHRSDVHRVVALAMIDMDGVVSTNDIVRMTGFSGRTVEFVWRDLRDDNVVISDTVCRYKLVPKS